MYVPLDQIPDLLVHMRPPVACRQEHGNRPARQAGHTLPHLYAFAFVHTSLGGWILSHPWYLHEQGIEFHGYRRDRNNKRVLMIWLFFSEYRVVSHGGIDQPESGNLGK